MTENSIPIEEISRLDVISANGNLYLTGWNRDEIRIKDQSDTNSIKTKKKAIEIHFPQDGIIHVPHHLKVKVHSVSGDAVIKGIGSEIEISSVLGDLILNDVGAAAVGSVTGDLIAKRIQGDLKVENTGGDAMVHDVKGQVGMSQVGGGILVEKIAGGFDINAEGDGTVDFSPVPWQAYQVKVAGDLSLSLPEECDADLSIQSEAKDITVLLGNIDIRSRQAKLSQQLGEGGPSIILSSGGKVYVGSNYFNGFAELKMHAKDFGSFSADFSAKTADQIKGSLGNLEEDLKESLSGLSDTLEEFGLSEENLRKFGVQIEETSKLAADKAELAAVRAQAKVEKRIAKARRKTLKAQAKLKEFDLGEFLEEQTGKQAVNESERLLILEMLQEKKISLDEADELLKALEGKK
jgi:hypothetical protein